MSVTLITEMAVEWFILDVCHSGHYRPVGYSVSALYVHVCMYCMYNIYVYILVMCISVYVYGSVHTSPYYI